MLCVKSVLLLRFCSFTALAPACLALVIIDFAFSISPWWLQPISAIT